MQIIDNIHLLLKHETLLCECDAFINDEFECDFIITYYMNDILNN